MAVRPIQLIADPHEIQDSLVTVKVLLYHFGSTDIDEIGRYSPGFILLEHKVSDGKVQMQDALVVHIANEARQQIEPLLFVAPLELFLPLPES